MLKQCFVAKAVCACLVFTPIVMADTPAVANPALSQWVSQVLSQNPKIQAAQAAIQAAGARHRAADQPLFNPELEFEYERTDTNTFLGGVSQTLDWSNKRAARTTVANFAWQATKAELHLVRQDIAADLLRALADGHSAQAVLQVSEKQTALMARFVHLAQRRRKAGDLNQIALDLAHLAAAEAAFAQADAVDAQLQARQAVLRLSGQASKNWPPLPKQLPSITLQEAEITQRLNALPAMQLALAQISTARAAIKRSVRDKRPDPTLGFRLGKEDSEILTGLSLSIPLFVRNTFSAEVEVSQAELLQAEQTAADIQQQARAKLVVAAQRYKNARQAWDAWQKSGAARLHQRTELLDRLWQAGELSTTEYLVQLTQTLDTERSAIDQRGRMWQAWITWLAASAQVETWLHLTGEQK